MKKLRIILLGIAITAGAGCEYYDDKSAATIDGSRTQTQGTTTPSATDEKISDLSKQIDDLKNQMATSNAEEIKALEEKIAELEKKLAEAQAEGGPEGGPICASGYLCDANYTDNVCKHIAPPLCAGGSVLQSQGTCGVPSCPGTCHACVPIEGGSTDDGKGPMVQFSPGSIKIMDVTHPTVASTDPQHNATNFGLTKKITVTFNEAMDGSTMHPNFSVKRFAVLFPVDATSEGTWAYNSGTKALTWSPKDSWVGEKMMNPGCYFLTLAKGIKDLSGNGLDKEYKINFRTEGVKEDCITFLCGSGTGKIPNCQEGFVCSAEGECKQE